MEWKNLGKNPFKINLQMIWSVAFPQLLRLHQCLFSSSFSFLTHNLHWSYSTPNSFKGKLSLLATSLFPSAFSFPSFVTFHLTPRVPRRLLQLCLGGSKLRRRKLPFEVITHLTASFHSCHWAAGSFHAVGDLDAGSPKQLSLMRQRTEDRRRSAQTVVLPRQKPPSARAVQFVLLKIALSCSAMNKR